MIFLPNKYERFCATLRNRIQKRCFDMPLSPKNREILRKIYFAEAVFKENEPIPIDIKNYVQNLLGAVQILKIGREEKFSFRVETEEKYLLDKKRLEILFIALAQNSGYINVYQHNFELVIRADTELDRIIKSLLKKIDAYWLYEIKSRQTVIVLSANTTSKSYETSSSEAEILNNPFSSVNIFVKKSAP